ncbi:glycosyltransferase family 1 protein [Paenibacillus macerans]|uniref:glycosyltransferase family 4 protein n=1 Tax=Paenibacillus macerans TaxID=44252 RepID=UPI00203DE00E|nr:glycosyltransferase family 1 protein [Paenibacillus macerans]MCM3698893.1 glycosyltransferase family 1 protein [Paenibacillus macerans]
MKIAFITETFYPSTNGVVTRLMQSIRWLVREGHEVLVIAPDQGVSEVEGAQVIGVPSLRFFLYPNLPLALPSRRVGKALQAFKPDLVHVVNPAVLGVAGIWYGRRYPLIASYHTHIPQYADFYKLPWLKPILWGYLRRLHNRADLNLCTSGAVRDELVSREFSNVRLWQRGVDTELFGPRHRNEEMRRMLSGGALDKRLLLYVGRLAAEKEIERLRGVLLASDRFRLAIVGDGPHRERLESHFAGTGTVFTGFLHGEQLAQAYASSDIFAFPSTTETLGLVLLEAMASGLTVVAAASPPSREQIREGATGFLYDPDIPSSLVNAILPLLDEELLRRMGDRAREEALTQGWNEPSRQLLELYRTVMADPLSGRTPAVVGKSAKRAR